MNSRLKPKTCTICQNEIIGGPMAKYCPACRAERIRQRDREKHQRKLAGTIRKLGSIDLCVICGEKYTVNNGTQKYCPACRIVEFKRRRYELWAVEYYNDPVKHQKYLERTKDWKKKHPDRVKTMSRNNYLNNIDKINDQRRKRCGFKLRPLGRTEICPQCSNDFTVLERNQKYCDNCRECR